MKKKKSLSYLAIKGAFCYSLRSLDIKTTIDANVPEINFQYPAKSTRQWPTFRIIPSYPRSGLKISVQWPNRQGSHAERSFLVCKQINPRRNESKLWAAKSVKTQDHNSVSPAFPNICKISLFPFFPENTFNRRKQIAFNWRLAGAVCTPLASSESLMKKETTSINNIASIRRKARRGPSFRSAITLIRLRTSTGRGMTTSTASEISRETSGSATNTSTGKPAFAITSRLNVFFSTVWRHATKTWCCESYSKISRIITCGWNTDRSKSAPKSLTTAWCSTSIGVQSLTPSSTTIINHLARLIEIMNSRTRLVHKRWELAGGSRSEYEVAVARI